MRCVRFGGLRSYLERLLDDVALGASGQRMRGEAVGALIQRTAERLNYLADRDQLTADCLSLESRDLLGWFRYFSRDEHFAGYLRAVESALAALKRQPSPRWRDPLLVHFRPTSNLFRWRVTQDGTRITLPTPMIVLNPQQFDELAERIAGVSHTTSANRSMLSLEYRRVAGELAAAGGIADRAVGRTHDLHVSFDRVNLEYFEGRFERPRLTWGSRQTLRKFGHYDFVQDLVMLSRTLDAPDVPAFVIDHVMHHELLHKKHGIRFKKGRRHAHLPEFRTEEQTFRYYREADQFLESLSRELRSCSYARA